MAATLVTFWFKLHHFYPTQLKRPAPFFSNDSQEKQQLYIMDYTLSPCCIWMPVLVYEVDLTKAHLLKVC